jgi:hypothetical protein
MHLTNKRRRQASRFRQAVTAADIEQCDRDARFFRGAVIAIALGLLFWLGVAAMVIVWPRMQAAAGIP